MTLPDELTDDYLHFDGVEDVSLQQAEPPNQLVANVKALRGAAVQEPTNGDIDALQSDTADTTWLLWNATLGGVAPQIGDTLTDGEGATWTVQTTRQEVMGTRWRLLCRRQL